MREDAEISTTIANLRTLISEVSSYYVGHGTFGDVPWNDVTNVPLRTHGNGNASTTVNITTPANGTDSGAYLVAGGLPCIGVQLVNRQRRTDGSGTYVPAHILLTEHGNVSSGVCQQVRTSRVVNDYFTSTVQNVAGNGNISAAIPVGSSKGIHEARTGG